MPQLSLYDRIFYRLNRKSVRGKDRLYALFRRSGFRKLIVSKAKYGLYLNLNPYEYIDSLVLKEGFYESEVTDELLKNLSTGDTFWDIGANIGLHSLAIKKNMPGVSVVSFEPNPVTHALLIANAALNELKIETCSFPLFDKTQIISLHVMEGNSGMSTLVPSGEIDFRSVVQCQAVKGDDLIGQGFNIPSIIKIDTEGAEIQVLNGCSGFLGNPLCRGIIIEAGNNILEEQDKDELTALLGTFGFTQIKKLARKENSDHALSNFLFLK